MEKTYFFKLKLQESAGNYVLNIKPVTRTKRQAPYPIDFAELNTPVIMNKFSTTNSSDLEYFLDFEKSFDKKGENYNVLNKKNLRRVLSDLGRIADEDLRKDICGESKLRGKRYKVISDDGLGESYNTCTRFGNPNFSRQAKSARNLKDISASD